MYAYHIRISSMKHGNFWRLLHVVLKSTHLQLVDQLILRKLVFRGNRNTVLGEQRSARLVHGIAYENAPEVDRHVILEQTEPLNILFV